MAQAAWEQFLAAGAVISARNRRALLQTLERVKRSGQTARARARGSRP